MDQMKRGARTAGMALLLECASLAARHIPIAARLLLVDSGVRRELTAERSTSGAECERRRPAQA